MSKVSLKWPRMPATAMAIPAKYVKVSPTKTSDGYQLKSSRAAVVAASGSIRYSENRCPSLQSKGIQIKALTPTNREAGKERGQLLPHGLERGCKLDGACQCKLLLGLKVQPEADGMLVTSSTGNLSTCLQSRLGCAKCYLQIWRCIVGWQSQEDSNPGEAHLMVSTRWCMSIWMSTKT